MEDGQIGHRTPVTIVDLEQIALDSKIKQGFVHPRLLVAMVQHALEILLKLCHVPVLLVSKFGLEPLLLLIF